jgi:multidrug resistance efflux pump
VEARIDGQIIDVMTNIRGLVERVLITESQLVEKGDLLLELDQRMIRAPVAGRVLTRNVHPREYAAPAEPLVSILDSDDLWVLARFGAEDFDRLRVGQLARVGVAGDFFAARLTGLIGPEEPALLEFVARPAVALRPGMVAAAIVAAG